MPAHTRLLFLLAAYAAFALWTQLTASTGLHGGLEPSAFRDFGSLWASGAAANQGLDPYGAYPLTARIRTPVGEWAAINLNPPVSVLLFQAIALVDPALVLRALQVSSILLYVGLALFLTGASPTQEQWLRVLLLLLWHPLWSTLNQGQLYVWLLVLVTVAVLRIRQQPVLAGICIGLLVALKPPYVLWPLLLLAAHQVRPSLIALLTAALVSALPMALGHSDWYGQWLDATHSSSGGWALADNLSALSLLARLGVPTTLSVVVVGLALVALVALVWRRQLGARDVSAIALVAVMLASPVSWIGYGVLLAPVFLLRAYWPEPLLIAALLFAIPGPLLFWSFPAAFAIYQVALALTLFALLSMERSSPAPASLQPGTSRPADALRDSW
jgi:hypothetical protein